MTQNSYLYSYQCWNSVVLAAFILASANVWADNPPHPLNSLKAGEWFEVPNSRLRDHEPSPKASGNLANIINAWSGGAYDTKRDRLLVWGGGGNDYRGNEIYAFDIETLTWHRLTEPSPNLGGDDANLNPDGTPRARRTYDTLEYLPTIDRFCAFGAADPTGGKTNHRVSCLNLDTLNWEQRQPGFNKGSGNTTGSVVAFDPASGFLWRKRVNSSLMERYDPITDIWAELGKPFPISNKGTAEIDPVQRKFVVLGRDNQSIWDVDSHQGPKPIEAVGPAPRQRNPGVAYDPSSGQIVVWEGGARVYTLNLGANVWLEHEPSNQVAPGKQASYGTYGRFRYVPSRNVFIVVNSVDENVFFYKLNENPPGLRLTDDQQPPTAPDHLDTKVISSIQVDLEWPKAADNVAIAGYIVYQNDQAVATTTATHYSLTELAAGTDYAFAVAAFDNAGNLSPRSPRETVTTPVFEGGACFSMEFGELESDRPTFHSLGFALPILRGDPNGNATVQVHYRRQGETEWRQALPMIRVKPATLSQESPPPHPVSEQFAGSVMNLDVDTAYEAKFEIFDPDGCERTLTASAHTRRPPPEQPETPHPTRVGSLTELQTILSNARAGDVITLAAGIHRADADGNAAVLVDKARGTPENPIVIRGEGDRETIIDAVDKAFGIRLNSSDYVIVENLHIRHAKTGIRLHGNAKGITLRANLITDVVKGIDTRYYTKQDLVICNNQLRGGVVFPDIDNATWNFEGIVLHGQGGVVCHNTLSGFGDALGFSKAAETKHPHRSNDFYGNEVLWSGDDCFEFDFSERNNRFFRNRCTNTGNGISAQPVFGGPAYAFQNIVYNIQRTTQLKLNNQPSGVLFYHNLFGLPWYAYASAAFNVDIRNNLFVGTPLTRNIVTDISTRFFGADKSHQALIDYNGWYYDGRFRFNSSWNNLATMQNASQYEHHGLILSRPLFASEIMVPELKEIFLDPIDPSLHPSSNAIDAGVILPNINDDFAGSGPDLGPLEAGHTPWIYGPTTGAFGNYSVSARNTDQRRLAGQDQPAIVEDSLDLPIAPAALQQAAMAPESALGTLAKRMEPGSWAELDTVFPDGPKKFFLTREFKSNILQWGDSAAWSPATEQVLYFGDGSGMGGTGKFIVYDVASNHWSLGSHPFEGKGHGYDHNTFDRNGNYYYYLYAGGYVLWRYDVVNNRWEKINHGFETKGTAHAIAHFPELGGVVHLDGHFRPSRLYLLQDKDQTWVHLDTSELPVISNHAFMEYLPLAKLVLFGGGNDTPQKMWILDAEGKIKEAADAPINLSVNKSLHAVDPVSGELIVTGGRKAGGVYSYDVTSNTWRHLDQIELPEAFDELGNGMINVTLDAYDVIMYVKYDFDNTKIWLYKSDRSISTAPGEATIIGSAEPVPSLQTTALAILVVLMVLGAAFVLRSNRTIV